jgi:hypothetical protein
MDMKKIPLLFIFGLVILPDCFSQNMLIIGGEYNPFKPAFWDSNIGFNIEVLDQHIQNDILFAFGGIWARNEEEKRPQKFLFSLKDKIFYSLDGRYVGLRAGVSAAFGIYDLSEFPQRTDLFFSAGGFAGICIFPHSPFSVTLDVCPGYALAFYVTDAPGASVNDSGFMLPISLGLRFNIDKL